MRAQGHGTVTTLFGQSKVGEDLGGGWRKVEGRLEDELEDQLGLEEEREEELEEALGG